MRRCRAVLYFIFEATHSTRGALLCGARTRGPALTCCRRLGASAARSATHDTVQTKPVLGLPMASFKMRRRRDDVEKARAQWREQRRRPVKKLIHRRTGDGCAFWLDFPRGAERAGRGHGARIPGFRSSRPAARACTTRRRHYPGPLSARANTAPPHTRRKVTTTPS